MTTEALQRARIVAEARKWIGTPYHSNAAMLGVGVDCGCLLREIFVGADLVPWFDIPHAASDAHLHGAEERYLGFVETYLQPLDAPGIGDVALFRIGRVYSHGGIITGVDPMLMIHAHMRVGRVAEERMRKGMGYFLPKYAPRFHGYWAKP